MLSKDAVCDGKMPMPYEMQREQAFIDGQWVNADGGATLTVLNPSTRKAIGTVPDMGVMETRRAIAAARRALGPWQTLLPQTRGDILRRWYELILKHREELAILITAEQGKPIHEALGEIDYAASFVRWFGEEASRLYGDTIPSHLPGRSLAVRRTPVGVVAAVTPWNFPSGMLTRKAAAALAAGCTVVACPSPETPFSALALAALAKQAGLPAGVLSVLTGDPPRIVGELCSATDVRALSFTGSTEVGRILARQCAGNIKNVCMELGGHAPFIVFDDCDLDDAVAAAVEAKFQTSGQDCLAANRIFVHQDIYEEFVCRYSKAAGKLRVGDGFATNVDIGPLINTSAVEKCARQVEDAIKLGARLTQGGHRPNGSSNFYPPTVLADVTRDMKIFRQETFGPVAAIMPFGDESDVIDAANDSEYGLIAYVYTRDNKRALGFSERLEYGMVAVNTIKVTGAPIPFGGVKQSGLGREGARQGIEAFTELKYVCMAK